MYPFFRKITLALIVSYCLFAVGCAPQKDYSKEYNYFQDADSLKKVMVKLSEYQIHKDDILAIGISSASMNLEQLQPFMAVAKTENGQQVAALPDYTVDADGNIQLPLIGKVMVEGLTRKTAQGALELKLSDYISKPSVSVVVKNFGVTVLGEVKLPGRHLMPNTNATLLDALGAAGDLTPYGNRKDVLLMRQDARGEAEFTKLDMTKANNFMNSGKFQLVQNDVIYVPTNELKVKEAMTDPEKKFRLYSIIFAGISSLAILVNTIVLLTR